MSPGPTFERVYLALKRQLRDGTRAPGAPLEPTAIGDELGSSFTPVRDALHRLVGEGLVETPRHNGFAVPHPTEQALRDLYAWNGDVLIMIVSHLRGKLTVSDPLGEPDDDAHAASALFLAFAEASGNREQVRAIAQLNDRLAPYRRVEGELIPDAREEKIALRRMVEAEARADLGRALARYHKRRSALVPKILAALSRD